MRIRFKIDEEIGQRLLEAIALSVTFLVPVAIRWVPEAQFPYPIGYDTPSYMAEAKAYSREARIFPLLYRILGWLTSAGLDPIVTMKYLPTLLYGFLGVSVYYFARRYLEWGRGKSLSATFVLALSAVSLRVSWDLNKQVFATIFLFLALSQTSKLRERFRAAMFFGLGLVVAASHELVFALMSGILLYLILSETYHGLRAKRIDWRLLSTTFVALVGGLLVFVGGWFHWDVSSLYLTGTLRIVSIADVGYSPWVEAMEKYGTLATLCYAPLTPLGVLGLFRRRALTGWTLVAVVGSFSVFVSPWLSLSLPDRWMYLLIYPTAFFVTNAFGRLGLTNRLNAQRLLLMGMALILISFVSFSLLGMSQWPTWYPKAPEFFPESLSLSSIPIHDIEATAQLMQSLNRRSQASVLITHMNYQGWAAYYANHQVIGWSDLWTPVPAKSIPRNVSEALDVAKVRRESDIYLLWYGDTDASSLGFTKIAESGPMKLYEYHR